MQCRSKRQSMAHNPSSRQPWCLDERHFQGPYPAYTSLLVSESSLSTFNAIYNHSLRAGARSVTAGIRRQKRRGRPVSSQQNPWKADRPTVVHSAVLLSQKGVQGPHHARLQRSTAAQVSITIGFAGVHDVGPPAGLTHCISWVAALASASLNGERVGLTRAQRGQRGHAVTERYCPEVWLHNAHHPGIRP